MSEASRTQRFVGEYLQNNNVSTVRVPHVYLAFTLGGSGFIVSEYIDGQMCDDSDVSFVAAGVQALITIPSPSSTPGPIGGLSAFERNETSTGSTGLGEACRRGLKAVVQSRLLSYERTLASSKYFSYNNSYT